MINLRLRGTKELASHYTAMKGRSSDETQERSDVIAHKRSSALLPYDKDAAIVQNTLEALLCIAFKVLVDAFPLPQISHITL